jgi:hypothetical protein
MHKNHPLRIFAVSGILTLALGVLVAATGGMEMLWLYAVLVLLEITFSFDNAVVNSRILTKLSPLWQTLFLTVGIFLAVFVVRFLLPVFIVMLSAGLSGAQVINLVLYDPASYGKHLDAAAPLINAFGGTFLVMISLSYFVDREKDVHWLARIEHLLARVGEVRFVKLLTMLIVAFVLYMTVAPELQEAVVISSLLGIALHVGLDGVTKLFGNGKDASSKKHVAGMAAFAWFMYLQVLDASFSFDGVIGAFAITSSVVLIMAGLGAGALWVRSLTVYLVRTGTLAKYKYLEHGAHWAILALGLIMLAKLYHLEMPEWLTGSVGLIFVATALGTSIIEKRLKH